MHELLVTSVDFRFHGVLVRAGLDLADDLNLVELSVFLDDGSLAHIPDDVIDWIDPVILAGINAEAVVALKKQDAEDAAFEAAEDKYDRGIV